MARARSSFSPVTTGLRPPFRPRAAAARGQRGSAPGSFAGQPPGRVAALYRRTRMAHRQLLTDEERQTLLGIPLDADSMARCFTLSGADQDLVAGRRRDANRIGFAVQLALLRRPGIALAQLERPVEPLVRWLASHLEIPAAPFAEYARRPQTQTDHARLLAKTLGLRPPTNA